MGCPLYLHIPVRTANACVGQESGSKLEKELRNPTREI
jgi:hypothetical protein